MAEPSAQVETSRRALAPFLTVIGVLLVSRIAYWPPGIVGKDGPLYIASMSLDERYSVPPPGNIGWVLLGKAFHSLGLSPVDAFTMVSVLLSIAGGAYFYMLCTRLMRPWLAAATALACFLSPIVWYHSQTIMSYETWLCVPPAIAFYGLRYKEERRDRWMYGAALTTGLGTILRPDMVAFSGPLLFAMLVYARAPLRVWAGSLAVCAACCCVWFFGMSWVLGGVERFVSSVRNQSEYIQTFGATGKGLVEGLARNGAKYAMILAWGSVFVAPLALAAKLRLIRRPRENAPAILIVLAAVLPSLYFAIWLFMGNAGLVLPVVGTMFLGAGWWLARASEERGWLEKTAAGVMAGVGLLGAVQFVFAPLLPPTDQRNVIINVTFTRYSGPGIREIYDYNLTDFGIDPSLANTIRQMKRPERVPTLPGPASAEPWPRDPAGI